MTLRERKASPITIAGIGETGPVPEDPRSIPEMALDAVEQALADAGAGYSDIDAVVTASVDLYDGLTASNIAITEVAGAVMKPETRISADGLAALIHAACQIWAGAYNNVLVVAHGKASMADHQSLTEWAMDPISFGSLGVDFATCAGLQARMIAAKDENAPQRWANLVAHRSSSAARAGTNDFKLASTAAEVLESPVLASPLREAMCAPMGDGATAILLSAEPASDSTNPLILSGVGHDLSAHADWDGTAPAWPGLTRAYARACSMLGEDDKSLAIDLYEPSCHYAHEEELFARALGLGDSAIVSPTGGLFGGAVPIAAGLSRFCSAARQMRDNSSLTRALVHGTWGPIGQGQAVAIMERSS